MTALRHSIGGRSEHAGEHVVHRIAHAIYGLIVLTATVGELRVHETDPSSGLVFVLSGALVLVIAHSYSQIVAEAALSDTSLSWRDIGPILVDQLALAVPAGIAAIIIGLAVADVWTADQAYTIVLVCSLIGLFTAGLAIGRHKNRTRLQTVSLAVGGTVIGIAVIIVEVAVGH